MATNTNILLESGTNELEVVEFSIKYADKSGKIVSQSYGINVAKVREIIRMPQLTKMPTLPNAIYGVFNLRGHIIPALDLSRFLYSVGNYDKENKMIIAEFNKVQVGFIVQDVQRIHRISWTDIVSPDTMHEIDPENSSIVGIIHNNGKHILMLDVEKIVADIDPTSAIDQKKTDITVSRKPIAITAEDSTTIRRMITDKLKLAGFDIISFKDGKEAWDKLNEISKEVAQGKLLKDFVQVVITDIEMPVLDGYSLTKSIKSNPYLANLPVVIFSSIISEDVLHKGKSVGADAQLTKPQIGELLDTVRYLIEKNLGVNFN